MNLLLTVEEVADNDALYPATIQVAEPSCNHIPPSTSHPDSTSSTTDTTIAVTDNQEEENTKMSIYTPSVITTITAEPESAYNSVADTVVGVGSQFEAEGQLPQTG